MNKTYKFNENQLNNLLIFLDRIEIKGLKEIQAINEILTVLYQPVEENTSESN